MLASYRRSLDQVNEKSNEQNRKEKKNEHAQGKADELKDAQKCGASWLHNLIPFRNNWKPINWEDNKVLSESTSASWGKQNDWQCRLGWRSDWATGGGS